MKEGWRGLVFNHYWTTGPSKHVQSSGVSEIQSLYSFSVAALTYSHQVRGLKREKCILQKFWRAELQHQLLWAQFKVWAGLCSVLCLLRYQSGGGGVGVGGLPAFFCLWPQSSHHLPLCLPQPSFFVCLTRMRDSI